MLTESDSVHQFQTSLTAKHMMGAYQTSRIRCEITGGICHKLTRHIKSISSLPRSEYAFSNRSTVTVHALSILLCHTYRICWSSVLMQLRWAEQMQGAPVNATAAEWMDSADKNSIHIAWLPGVFGYSNCDPSACTHLDCPITCGTRLVRSTAHATVLTMESVARKPGKAVSHKGFWTVLNRLRCNNPRTDIGTLFHHGSRFLTKKAWDVVYWAVQPPP